MDDIIIVKPGLKAQIYFRHVCSSCWAILEVRDTIQDFKCPCCEHDETCLQSPEAMTKKYNVEAPKSDHQKDQPKENSPRKTSSKKSNLLGKLG